MPSRLENHFKDAVLDSNRNRARPLTVLTQIRPSASALIARMVAFEPSALAIEVTRRGSLFSTKAKPPRVPTQTRPCESSSSALICSLGKPSARPSRTTLAFPRQRDDTRPLLVPIQRFPSLAGKIARTDALESASFGDTSSNRSPFMRCRPPPLVPTQSTPSPSSASDKIAPLSSPCSRL